MCWKHTSLDYLPVPLLHRSDDSCCLCRTLTPTLACGNSKPSHRKRCVLVSTSPSEAALLMDAETTSEADQRLASLPLPLSSVINTWADSAVISHAAQTLRNVLGATELWLAMMNIHFISLTIWKNQVNVQNMEAFSQIGQSQSASDNWLEFWYTLLNKIWRLREK